VPAALEDGREGRQGAKGAKGCPFPEGLPDRCGSTGGVDDSARGGFGPSEDEREDAKARREEKAVSGFRFQGSGFSNLRRPKLIISLIHVRPPSTDDQYPLSISFLPFSSRLCVFALIL